MAKILALRHMYSGSLFTLEYVFKKAAIDFDYVEGFSTDLNAIDIESYDALVILGGAMGVYETDHYPHINDEITLVGKWLEKDRPTLGICLGAQLIAKAKGYDVYKGKEGSEFGFMPVELTDAGRNSPMRHFDSAKTHILQMHGDTFDLPGDAVLLASSPKYKNQAYQIGKSCFATQFHPEMNRVGLENTLVEDNGHIDVLGLREDGQKYLPRMVAQTETFMNELLNIWQLGY